MRRKRKKRRFISMGSCQANTWQLSFHTSKNSPGERRMAALLYCTGMRIEEVLGLRWENIDTERGCIHIRRAVVHPGRNMPEIKSRANHPASASPSRRTQSRRRNGIPPEQLHGPVKRNSVELYRSRKIVQTYPKTMRCRRVYRPRLPRHLCTRVARIRHFYRFDCPSSRTQKN